MGMVRRRLLERREKQTGFRAKIAVFDFGNDEGNLVTPSSLKVTHVVIFAVASGGAGLCVAQSVDCCCRYHFWSTF